MHLSFLGTSNSTSTWTLKPIFYISAPLIFGDQQQYLYLDLETNRMKKLEEKTVFNVNTHVLQHLVNQFTRACKTTNLTQRFKGVNYLSKLKFIVLTAHRQDGKSTKIKKLSYRIYGNLLFQNARSMKTFVQTYYKGKITVGDITFRSESLLDTSVYRNGCSLLR